MSQSDYVQRKKIAIELNAGNQTKFSNILNAESYTLYKQYSLENRIQNTSNRYNQLAPNRVVNDSSCSDFMVCKNTHLRPYRTLSNPINFTPSVSNINTLFDTSFNKLRDKFAPIRTCHKCCYDSSYNRTHTNNANTLFSSFNNRRLKNLFCKCKQI